MADRVPAAQAEPPVETTIVFCRLRSSTGAADRANTAPPPPSAPALPAAAPPAPPQPTRPGGAVEAPPAPAVLATTAAWSRTRLPVLEMPPPSAPAPPALQPVCPGTAGPVAAPAGRPPLILSPRRMSRAGLTTD